MILALLASISVYIINTLSKRLGISTYTVSKMVNEALIPTILCLGAICDSNCSPVRYIVTDAYVLTLNKPYVI